VRHNAELAPDAVRLADGADANAFAIMLSELVRQNLEAKPGKIRDFNQLVGSVALIAHDADVSLTLRFQRGHLVVHNGILGITDVTIRGSSEVILGLSSMPLLGPSRFSLPLPSDAEGLATVSRLVKAMRDGSFRIYGMTFRLRLLLRLTRVMSIHDPQPIRTLTGMVDLLAKKARNRH
jgi:hypothetical protein